MMRSRKAVALAYTDGDSAPKIVAKGRSRGADRIIELAEKAGVPIVEDAALAGLLEPFEFGTIVPEAYWEAVARVLASVMDIEEVK